MPNCRLPSPEAKRMDTIFRALPAAAAQYRTRIDKGLQCNALEAGRAYVAMRKLLGERIDLVPVKGGGHRIEHFEFQRAALLAGSEIARRERVMRRARKSAHSISSRKVLRAESPAC